jgi:hypothetical protein
MNLADEPVCHAQNHCILFGLRGVDRHAGAEIESGPSDKVRCDT